MQRGCRGEAIGRSGARCDLLGDIVSALDTAEPGELSEFYSSAIYHHVEQIVEVSRWPIVWRSVSEEGHAP